MRNDWFEMADVIIVAEQAILAHQIGAMTGGAGIFVNRAEAAVENRRVVFAGFKGRGVGFLSGGILGHGVAGETSAGIHEAQVGGVREVIELVFQRIGLRRHPIHSLDRRVIHAMALRAHPDCGGSGELLEQGLRNGGIRGVVGIHGKVHPRTEKTIAMAARMIKKCE